MKPHCILMLVVFCFFALAFGAEKPSYKELVAKAKAGDRDFDLKELRASYLTTQEYSSFFEDDLRKEMNEALAKEDYKKALQISNKILDQKYISLDAHYASFVANSKLGNDKDAELHKGLFLGLVKAILSQGDGKSVETAWPVIEVHEEYVVLSVLGFPPLPLEQSYLHKDGHTYDEMKVKDPKSGKDLVFYFNTDIPDKKLTSGLRK